MKDRHHRGLTFLELLMTLAMSALMIVALGQIIYSLTRALAATEEGPQKSAHMDGLSAFLSYGLAQSSFNPPGQPPNLWHTAPGAAHPTLGFRLEHPPPFFVTPIRPPPEITAFVDFDAEAGLRLLWHVKPAHTGDRPRLRVTPLSSHVKDFEYGYWNDTNSELEWESAADEGAVRPQQQPQFIRLVFDWNGSIDERVLNLQPRVNHILNY